MICGTGLSACWCKRQMIAWARVVHAASSRLLGMRRPALWPCLLFLVALLKWNGFWPAGLAGGLRWSKGKTMVLRLDHVRSALPVDLSVGLAGQGDWGIVGRRASMGQAMETGTRQGRVMEPRHVRISAFEWLNRVG